MTGLLAKRVLLVGAGGLGSPVALLLARAGVGLLEVLDDDIVELSNLQRQVLYDSADIGERKAPRAAAYIEAEARDAGHLSVRAVAREKRLYPDTALELVRGFDVVVEGTDNFPSKFLAADACALAGVTCVQGGAVRWGGWALASVPGVSACLRCAFEDIPVGPDRGCSTAGVIGPVVGVIGALQASLTLRLLRGELAAAGVLHHYRGIEGSLRCRKLMRSSSCPLCSRELQTIDPSRYVAAECAA
jgi:molybdopterin/thiamine biosynthesis adenylyltransferase